MSREERVADSPRHVPEGTVPLVAFEGDAYECGRAYAEYTLEYHPGYRTYLDMAWEFTDLSDVAGFAPNPHPVVWTFSAGAGVDVFVKPKAGLNLYGVSDLTAAAIPYISANARFIPPPQNFVLTAGVDGIITYELGIFDWNLVDETWFFPGPQWVLFSWTAGE